MKATIRHDGILVIIAENELEHYALTIWNDDDNSGMKIDTESYLKVNPYKDGTNI